MVVFADGKDLADVVESVDEVKASPLLGGERSEDDVRDGAPAAEDGFGARGEVSEANEVGVDAEGEVVSRAQRGREGGADGRGGGAARGKEAETNDAKLTEALGDGGHGAGGRALGQALFHDAAGCAVGEEEVLDDLLDAPLFGMIEWGELGLSGVEAGEDWGYFSFKLYQIRAHGARI